jgi:gliding motility-associated-like protein
MQYIAAGSAVITYKAGPDLHGCSAIAVVTVNVVTNSFTVTGAVTNVACYGDSTGAIALTVDPPGGSYTYSWSHGDTGATATGLPVGSYSVLVTQPATQCKWDTTFVVEQPDSLKGFFTGHDKHCNMEGLLKAEVTGGVTPYSYLWTGNGISDTAAAVGPVPVGQYKLLLTDANGCKWEWTGYVYDGQCIELGVMEAFSPNGDGINDKWGISGLQEYPLNTVQVFDKWGDVVYEKKGYDNSWNGTKHNGGDLPDGTYYYVVKFNEPSKLGGSDVYKGMVMIKR